MESTIVAHLQPEFEPVAVVWADELPDGAVEFKAGRFGCILNLFAEASVRGRVAGGSRDTVVCNGGRAALGVGVDFFGSEERVDHLATIFSKGLASARDESAYVQKMRSARASFQPLLEFGERRHSDREMARRWILDCLPRHDIPNRYVWFKPLSATGSDENIRTVVFPVGPVELAGLITLAGSVVEGADPVHVPQGPDCLRVGCFTYDQYDEKQPRAVLGMLDVDGREVMHRRFHDDTLTLAIPMPLFLRMEEEAADSVLTIPRWTTLRGIGDSGGLQ